MDSILFIALSGETLPDQKPLPEKQLEKHPAEAAHPQIVLPEAAN